jgi:hypothetical protein
MQGRSRFPAPPLAGEAELDRVGREAIQAVQCGGSSVGGDRTLRRGADRHHHSLGKGLRMGHQGEHAGNGLAQDLQREQAPDRPPRNASAGCLLSGHHPVL